MRCFVCNVLRCFLLNVLRCFVCTFTFWPIETVKDLVKNTITSEESRCSCMCNRDTDHLCTKSCCSCQCFRFIFRLVHILLIISGVFFQMITCFSRQNPYAHWMHHPNDTLIQDTNSSNQYCLLKCDIKKNFITGFIFPDAIISLLALWIYLIEPVAAIILKTECCNPLTDFLKIKKIYVDSPDKKLIEVVQNKQRRSKEFYYTSLRYLLIVTFYIVLSLSISGLYLHGFGINNNDVIIQSPIKIEILNSKRKVVLTALFFGFFALDLLYLQVIMRYAYQCTLLVYYLKSIKSKLTDEGNNNNGIDDGNEGNDEGNAQRNDRKFSRDDVKKAFKLLKQLNASSATTELVIIIAGFTAISCFINIFNTTDCHIHSLRKMQTLQVIAVTLRAILWTFVVIFPFNKAAQVNEAARKLSFNVALYHPEIKAAKYIATEIRLIGIRVRPWLPYVVIVVIIFVIMMGTNITSYIHFL